MSQLNAILENMHPDCWYTAKDMAERIHCSPSHAGQCLRMLVRGDLLEVRNDEQYRRRKQYKSRQRKLFA